jgi:uncharacterized protein (DUF697 family)
MKASKNWPWAKYLFALSYGLREFNQEIDEPFTIGLRGSPEQITALQERLLFFDHPLRERFSKKLMETPSFSLDHAKKCWKEIGPHDPVPEGLLFELSTDCWPVGELHEERQLISSLLDAHPRYQKALAFFLPAFRSVMMEREVSATVKRNTAWVATTALPNIVPGPHQVMTIPFEAGSDFVVLTFNELRMTMALTALSGVRVHPRELITQCAIVLSMAKAAQMVATQTLSKMPAGAGVVVKGAVAYAFTRAMGEAIVLYLVTGRASGRDFFTSRVDFWIKPGMAYIKEKLGKK